MGITIEEDGARRCSLRVVAPAMSRAEVSVDRSEGIVKEGCYREGRRDFPRALNRARDTILGNAEPWIEAIRRRKRAIPATPRCTR